MRGGPFCNLDQTHSECESIYVFPALKSSEVFTAIWDYILPEFVGFTRAVRPFLSDQPALKSRWGTLKSRRGGR